MVDRFAPNAKNAVPKAPKEPNEVLVGLMKVGISHRRLLITQTHEARRNCPAGGGCHRQGSLGDRTWNYRQGTAGRGGVDVVRSVAATLSAGERYPRSCSLKEPAPASPR